MQPEQVLNGRANGHDFISQAIVGDLDTTIYMQNQTAIADGQQTVVTDVPAAVHMQHS